MWHHQQPGMLLGTFDCWFIRKYFSRQRCNDKSRRGAIRDSHRVMQADEGTIRAGQNFNVTSLFN